MQIHWRVVFQASGAFLTYNFVSFSSLVVAEYLYKTRFNISFGWTKKMSKTFLGGLLYTSMLNVHIHRDVKKTC